MAFAMLKTVVFAPIQTASVKVPESTSVGSRHKLRVRADNDAIEDGSFMDDEALRLRKEKGTFDVPTLIAVWWIVQQVEQGKLTLTPLVVAKARAGWDSVGRPFTRRSTWECG